MKQTTKSSLYYFSAISFALLFSSVNILSSCGNNAKPTEFVDSTSATIDSIVDYKTAIDSKADKLKENNYLIRQYDAGRLIYTPKGESDNPTSSPIYIEDFHLNETTKINVSGNDITMGLFEGETPDIICLFSRSSQGGHCYMTRVNIADKKELKWTRIDAPGFSNIQKNDTGYVGKSSIHRVELTDSAVVEYDETCEVSINFNGQETTRTEAEKTYK